MLDKIGYVKEILFEALREHLIANCENLGKLYYYPKYLEGSSTKIDSTYDCLDKISRESKVRSKDGRWVDKFGDFGDWATSYRPIWGTESQEAYFIKFWDKKEAHLKKCIEHYTELGGKLEIVHATGRFFVIQYSSHKFIGLPREFVVIEEARSFDNDTVGELCAGLSSGTVGLVLSDSERALGVPSSAKMTDVKSTLELKREELALAEAEAKEKYELAKADMERKLQEMREEQEAQLALLNVEVEKLKDIIFVLELNMFALRSLFGDTFTLTQLSSGKKSGNPLVLYQKFRFLDEEFALLKAHWAVNNGYGGYIKPFDGSHGSAKEIFTRKDVQDLFLPSEKCITFFRVSKDNKYYAYDPEIDGLEALEYYHGSQVGMLIRNGENVWLSFIDEEVFVEDNLFESEATYAESEAKLKPDWKGEYNYQNDVIVAGKTKLRDYVVKKYINKMFLFYVLEGLVKSTNIFTELKGVNIRVPSDKVIFSSADNQIGASKYPDFKTYFKSWRERNEEGDVKVGDPILVIQRGAASHYNSMWKEEEHRSRGYENRARDAEDIEPGVNTVNFIEKVDKYYELKVNDKPYRVLEDGTVIYYRSEVEKDRMGEPNVVCEPEYKFFVSCVRHVDDWQRERRDAWGRTYLPSRVNNVNLRVYNDDFCPISYINSNYVLAWMEQKSIGDWCTGNYVYLVEKCFRTTLKYLREREQREMELILPLIPAWKNTPDELDALLAWRKKNKVKNFTEWQAKRFARWYKEGGGV